MLLVLVLKQEGLMKAVSLMPGHLRRSPMMSAASAAVGLFSAVTGYVLTDMVSF